MMALGDSLPQVQARIRAGLIRHGTDVEANAREPQGDGDQRRIENPTHQQFYREIFSVGGDLAECFETPGVISEFGNLCTFGDAPRVKALLEAADAPDLPHPTKELIQLLETRETSLRLSPLLMIVSVGKNLSMGSNDAELRRNQLKVAELLLEYGARPDARDVNGKTVCHYGAGVMATKTTMKIVERAAKSYETSYLFDQEVELTGLTDESKNGLRGFARGFKSSSGRRAVFLCDQGKQVAVKPENIKLVGSSTSTKPDERNLCDVQCRLGMTSIMETAMSDRGDVAEFLGKQMGASLDIKDCDGMDARTMAMRSGAERLAPALSVIKDVARKRAKEAAKADRRKCANCDKSEPTDEKFDVCSRCKAVRYCSKECQAAHWKTKHKKECTKLATLDAGVKLERPPSTGEYATTLNWQSGQTSAPSLKSQGYRKPNHVAVDELFYVKCQGGGPAMPIYIYDETRECNFDYQAELAGFEDMRAKITAEPAFQGRKTYMKASFDSAGTCTVYPNTATLKKW